MFLLISGLRAANAAGCTTAQSSKPSYVFAPRATITTASTLPSALPSLLDDPDQFHELDADITAADPLEFTRPSGSYVDRVAKARALTSRNEAIVCGVGPLSGRPVALGVMEFGFIAGSMGSATGEKITRLFEHARRHRLPVITVTASGGARPGRRPLCTDADGPNDGCGCPTR